MTDNRPHAFPTTAEGQLALVLWISWDPVGGTPDEYVSYSSALLGLLASGAADREIAAALGRLRAETMGASASPDDDLRAAWSVQDWYQWFVESDEPPVIDR